MPKMKPDIAALLNPMIVSEMEAKYFYMAARTWAKTVGYCGAKRQFKCFAEYHAKNVHDILNIFTKWDETPVYGELAGIELGNSLTLPGVLESAQETEDASYEAWESITVEIMSISPAIFERVNKIFCQQTKWWLEMSEYNEKLKLFTVTNPLDLVYFDRKILRW